MFTPSLIKETLIGLEDTWFPNELATLYSNSRTEMNIRDKFNMHFAEKLENDDRFFIQREWHRRDLAIIQHKDQQTAPVALFEFKARHAWFIASKERGRGNGESGYDKTFYGDNGAKNGVIQDIYKLSLYADEIPCYNVLIGVNPLERIPDKYDKFRIDCKEIKPINESFIKFGSAERIKELCNSNVRTFCTENNHEFIPLEYI